MTDNVDVTPGSGKTIAADDVGGIHYQRVKVAHGADGAATDVSTASPLPVDLVTGLTVKYAVIDVATSGDNTLVASVSSKHIRVLSYVIVASAAVTVRFEGGAGGTALTGQMQLSANSGVAAPFNPYGWFETAVTTLLNLELSGAVSVDGHLSYIEVA